MWPNSLEIADLVTFTEIILNGKLDFLCSVLTIAAMFSILPCSPILPDVLATPLNRMISGTYEQLHLDSAFQKVSCKYYVKKVSFLTIKWNVFDGWILLIIFAKSSTLVVWQGLDTLLRKLKSNWQFLSLSCDNLPSLITISN